MKTYLIVLATASVLTVPTQPPEWVHSLAEAQSQARTLDQPILIYCWADGSDYCTKLYQDTLSNKESAGEMADFVCYSAKHGDAGTKQVFETYGVTTLPTILFVEPGGKAEDLIQGFIPVDSFVAELARVKRGDGTVTDLENKLKAAAPGSDADVEARWLLAGKVQAFGQNERHDKLMASIRSIDPKGNTLIGSRLLLNEIVNHIVGSEDGQRSDQASEDDAQRKKGMAEWDLAPLYTHAKHAKLRAAKHEAWSRIGNLEVQKADMQAAFDAFHMAWKTCPEDKVVDWSNNVARWVIKRGDHSTSKEKKFALELAESALKTLKAQSQQAPPGKVGGEKRSIYEAYCWNTIALCHHILGKQQKAVKAQRQALALHETDQYLADLERMQQ